MDFLEPFLLNLDLTPDHSDSDIEAECKTLFTIQAMTEKFLCGQCNYDDLSDCLAQFNVEPYDYWDVVDANLNTVIESGTVLENASFLVDAYGSPISHVR